MEMVSMHVVKQSKLTKRNTKIKEKEARVSLILHEHFILKKNYVNLNIKRLYIG
jgi:hypothetical protein